MTVPHQIVFAFVQPVAQKFVVVATYKNTSMRRLQLNQKIKHGWRLAPAIYLITQKNQMILGRNLRPLKNLKQGTQSAVNVTDN
jgi:hypothetical protein